MPQALVSLKSQAGVGWLGCVAAAGAKALAPCAAAWAAAAAGAGPLVSEGLGRGVSLAGAYLQPPLTHSAAAVGVGVEESMRERGLGSGQCYTARQAHYGNAKQAQRPPKQAQGQQQGGRLRRLTLVALALVATEATVVLVSHLVGAHRRLATRVGLVAGAGAAAHAVAGGAAAGGRGRTRGHMGWW